MIRARLPLPRSLSALVLAAALTACQNTGGATEADGAVTPREVTVNPYGLDDHRACLTAGHQSGTPAYQQCRAAWVKARGSQGEPGAAIGFSGFF